MKIKLLTGLSDGVTGYKPQAVVDWADDADAARLIAAGHAVGPVDDHGNPTEAEDPKPKKKGK